MTVGTNYKQPGNEKWVEGTIEYTGTHKGGRGVIAIPAYKAGSELKAHEIASLKQCVKIFGGKYDIVLFVPTTFNANEYSKIAKFNFGVLKLNPDFFKRQKSYSNLCERYELYECFKEYEYMLLYQLDAWAFEDKLEYFMDMGYDYIGGVHLIYSKSKGENGNGGFSLRKIAKFTEVCANTDWSVVPGSQLEDCAFTQRLKANFNLAPVSVCYEFSWQENPSQGMIRNKNRLPFGCHAFHRFGASFWRKYIQY